MLKVTGLIRRGSTYSLRRRVPSDLVKALGKSEVVIALHTSSHKVAAEAARLESVRLDRLWESHREALKRGEAIDPTRKVTDVELRRVVAGEFWRQEQFATRLPYDDEIRENIEHDIAGYERRDPSAEAGLLAQAKTIIREQELPIEVPAATEMGQPAQPFQPSRELIQLVDLVRRADVEQLKRSLDRMDGQHGDREHDPMFKGISSVSQPPAIVEGITLGDAIRRFESDPLRAHLGDTADAKYVVTFRTMKEVIGVERALASIKVFDSVLVVSDRNVIDTQLQEAIFSFERNAGVVATIRNEGGAKSGQLAQALAGGKKIVVCTIQTFPFALEEVRNLAATQGKRFAVIADEAHSSQTGEAAAKLKAVLSAEEVASLNDGGEISSEDILTAQMASRAAESGITYVAFTATPKGKTLELFGRRPRPEEPPGDTNLPQPFHVYSMRQAIEEDFILDVLRNYTPYDLAFRLASQDDMLAEIEVERSEARKSLLRWVRLHPYNISQKVQIVVEHYRANVQPLLDGRAKAMVVVGSRLEAVRWQVAIQKYIKEQGYDLGTLVAFSGEVNDAKTGPDPFTETSKELNPGLAGRDIREAFKLPEYHILLVANKFQTGFDQPLLCGMYVDRRLAGIQAVQTLSRLNRAHPGKDTTYVLDFVNAGNDILAAFRTYFEGAELDNVTDPNIVLDLKAKLDGLGYYDEFEVNRVVDAELSPSSKQSDLVAAITPVADRLLRGFRNAQERQRVAQASKDQRAAKVAKDEMDALILFRTDIGAFIRLYAFLSQVIHFGNTAVEARHIFFRRLLPLLKFGREREVVDTSSIVLSHHKLSTKGKRDLALSPGMGEKLQAISDVGSGSVHEKETALLAEIIAKVNELFTGDTSNDDQLVYVNNVLKGKLMQSQLLGEQAANNTKEQFSNSPDLSQALIDAIIDAFDAHRSMSEQALNSKKVQEGLKDVLLGPGQLYEALRRGARDGGQPIHR
ncbi:DUF6538 domain-containing protein [Rhizobium leguminosarum]|uniref:DUF6538 domain-containing protein n=1 Tax=Rhizobium leguminosarum TaxID=384 RepID=UPI0021BC1739|nr:DUF6538 domain-containing protein [Rhizobium leguminosarum]